MIRNILLVLADVITVVFSWTLAILLYNPSCPKEYSNYSFYLRMWPVAVAFVLLNGLFRLYHGRFWRPAAPVPPVEELRRLVGSSLITHVGTIAVIAIARQTTMDYSRAVMIIAGVLTAFLAQPTRDLARRFLHAFAFGRIHVHFIGEGESAERRKAVLDEDVYTGFRVVEDGCRADIVVASVDPRILKCRMGELLRDHTLIEYLPPQGDYPVADAHLFQFGGAGGVEFVNQRQMRMLKFEKWLLDKLLAILTFVLVSPLFVVVPILIGLTSRGPIFYRQERLGRNGVPFRVWKFRTMYADADERLGRLLREDAQAAKEWEEGHKLREDPRVTTLGRFLRKSSIDEFPQLFNVLAGDMALVGPRPIVIGEVPFYGAAYSTFSSVLPGITGLWQVSGRSDTDYPSRVALDVRYVRNWSPWLDVWILMRTVGTVLLMRGAF